MSKLSLRFAAVLLLSSCMSNDAAPELATPRSAEVRADATLRDAAGREIGTATLIEDAGGVVVSVQATGLAPGLHGLHLHAVGACDGGTQPAFSSAGGHFNPTGRKHGQRNPEGHHLGDLGNLPVDAAGVGALRAGIDELSLAELLDADGAALVIHQNEDDLRTDAGPLGPGNSGARIACGVVEPRA